MSLLKKKQNITHLTGIAPFNKQQYTKHVKYNMPDYRKTALQL